VSATPRCRRWPRAEDATVRAARKDAEGIVRQAAVVALEDWIVRR
jgi:hypothetical protein